MVGQYNRLLEQYDDAAHNHMKRPQGYMTQDTFSRALSEFEQFGIKKVYLHFQGEHFLNPRTPSFAQQLKKRGIFVGVFTNGMAFTPDNILEVAAAEIDLIRFSIDGASAQTYEKNRVGGRFEKVMDALRAVVQAHQGKKTRIEWQFVVLRNNEHEIERARGMAKDLGVHLHVKGFRETDARLRPLDVRYHAKKLCKPCTDIYQQVGVYWNGDVVPCCYDTDAFEVMGNIMKNSLEKIWASYRYQRFRQNVKDAKRFPDQEPDVCRSCLRWE